jgi:hypothetical protein
MKESKRFFFEKKKQKTFAKWVPGFAMARAHATPPRHCEPRSGAAIQKRAAEAKASRPTVSMWRTTRVLRGAAHLPARRVSGLPRRYAARNDAGALESRRPGRTKYSSL